MYCGLPICVLFQRATLFGGKVRVGKWTNCGGYNIWTKYESVKNRKLTSGFESSRSSLLAACETINHLRATQTHPHARKWWRRWNDISVKDIYSTITTWFLKLNFLWFTLALITHNSHYNKYKQKYSWMLNLITIF